jgi:hypothetical protein
MVRRSDWAERLSAYLAAVAKKPHAYGKHDCLIFVAGAVKAQTGTDFARGHRGKYRSAASAARYLKGLGFESAAAMVAARLPEKPIGFAQRGDIVADADGIPGVCIGGEAVFVGMTEGREGLVRAPRAAWSKAWAV